jgi:hypothetical protein
MTELKIREFSPLRCPARFESVARLVPGYRGYAAKEDRREEDKRLRTQIARCLARRVAGHAPRGAHASRSRGCRRGLSRLGTVAKRLEPPGRGRASTPRTAIPASSSRCGSTNEGSSSCTRADIAVAEGGAGRDRRGRGWVLPPGRRHGNVREPRTSRSISPRERVEDTLRRCWPRNRSAPSPRRPKRAWGFCYGAARGDPRFPSCSGP